MKIYNVSLWSVKVPKTIQKGHCVCEPHVINIQSKPSTYWSPWFIEKYFHHNFVFKNFVNKLKISMVAILINVLFLKNSRTCKLFIQIITAWKMSKYKVDQIFILTAAFAFVLQVGFFRREKTFEELRQEEEETGKPTPNEYFNEIVEEWWSCFPFMNRKQINSQHIRMWNLCESKDLKTMCWQFNK